MSGSQAPEDVAAFKRIIESDPENKKCFECGYPHPLWCNINHGVFICMECSGVHRGLGVHLSFVRSATIDDWTAWRPEKLRQMEIGGNRKARLFFERLGVPKQPIRARYEHNGALMYKDKLEAEAQGKPFNEAAWKEPEWKQRMANNNANNIAGSGFGSGGNSKYQGIGSGGNAPAGGGGGDWFGAITDSWGKVANATTEYAQSTTKSLKEAGIQDKATESASWAWGNLTSYASTLGKLAAEGTSNLVSGTSNLVAATTGGQPEEDGLGALTRNVARTEAADDRFKGIEHRGAPVQANNDDGLSGLTHNVARTTESNERFKGYEHRAERGSNDNNDGWGEDDGWGNPTTGLRTLAGNLPKTNKYQGIGNDAPARSSPVPATKLVSPTRNTAVTTNSATPQPNKTTAEVSPSNKKAMIGITTSSNETYMPSSLISL